MNVWGGHYLNCDLNEEDEVFMCTSWRAPAKCRSAMVFKNCLRHTLCQETNWTPQEEGVNQGINCCIQCTDQDKTKGYLKHIYWILTHVFKWQQCASPIRCITLITLVLKLSSIWRLDDTTWRHQAGHPSSYAGSSLRSSSGAS